MNKPSPQNPSRAATERSRVSARAASVQEEFDQLHRQIRRLQRLATMGTTAATLAHEVNNLLTPVLGYAKFALTENDPALMIKALHTTVDQIDAVVSMTHRILDIAGDGPAEFRSVSLREIVQNAVLATCRDPKKDNIRLTVDVADAVTVHADTRQLQQVFFNLLINARDAMKNRPGQIKVSATQSDDSVEVVFSDTGCGIPPDRIDSIFDAFVTSKDIPGATGRGGSGLGLSVCREIVADHGGSIRVDSVPDEGATFHIILPVSSDAKPRRI